MLRSYRAQAFYKAYLVPLAGMVAGIVAVSLLIGVIRSAIAIPNLSVLYLLVVMFSAVTWGWWVALCSAVVAFLSYDFFFVEPIFTFTIRDPEEWVALLIFLAVAVVDRDKLDPVERKRLEDNIMLAEDLGIEVHEIASGGSRLAIGDALVQFAREHHATQLVLGQSARGRWQILLHGSVINHVLRHAENVDLHIMADRTNER